MKKNRNISIDELLLSKALTRAKSLGFNFSSYLAYLINNDLKGTNNKIEPRELEDIEETNIENLQDIINDIIS